MSFLLSIIMVAFSTGATTSMSQTPPPPQPVIRVGAGGGLSGGGDQCLAPCTYDEEGNVIDCPCG